MKRLNHKIILASKSPRRLQLLQEAGFTNIEVKTKDVEETYPANLATIRIAPYLAHKKATACSSFLEGERAVLLAADSVVILESEVFPKPKDALDAKRMLLQLSGKMHRVVTGVCLMDGIQTSVFHEVTEVYMGHLTGEEIDFYINNYQPFDKAGSYGIQEWIGHCKIEKIVGTYTNVMGLPVASVYAELAALIR